MTFDRDTFVNEAEALLARLGTVRPDAFCQWAGGERLADGSLTLPYPVYAPIEEEFWELLRSAGLASAPADYQRWFAERNVSDEDPSWLASASLEDVAMAALRIRRAERFCEGFIAGAFARGFLAAMLRRLVALANELPYVPQRSPFRAPILKSA